MKDDLLDDLLLEAAGRTGSPGKNRSSRPPARRQREASYSDDGSDSNDDNSDDDPGYASRKPSGSQVPLKKRLEASEKDDDRVSHGDDDESGDERMGSGSDDDEYGDDLYKDDYDREKLAQMSELEREMILSERAQKRDDQRLTERVRGKQSGKKAQTVKETPGPPSSRVRSSARFAEKAAAKDDALNELRAKRLKQQDPNAHRRLRDAGKRASVGRDSSPVRKKSARAASPSSDSNQSEDQSQSNSKDEESAGDEDLGESDEDRPSEEALTLEDIKDITIRRSKLGKWFMEPFFEELIVGCFVRVGVGRRGNKNYYRLCQVKNVDATVPNQQYALENKRTHKYLNVTWGSKEARWQMAVISESPPVELEFDQWVQAMERDSIRMPSRQEVLVKKEAIKKAVNFVYSSETVKQMLEEKKSASSRPLNIAAEKERLKRKLEAAKSQKDNKEVELIEERINALDALSKQGKNKNEKAVRLEEMNKRNRAENFRNASEIKPVNTSLKAGEAGYDPFSRRWTRSRNYYVANPSKDEAAALANGDATDASLESGDNNIAAAGATTEFGLATTAAALEAAADAGKLVDTSAPIDLGIDSNSMHNFDLPISLTKLQSFGGPQGAHAGFMARKQRIEATVGCRVPENDGRRHSLTLSVGDYKRRRGLL